MSVRSRINEFLDSRFALCSLGIVLALIVRLPLLLGNNFPLGDGGFFFNIVEEFRRLGFSYPTQISYNGYAIPFFYPPLGFILTACIGELFHLPTLIVMQYLPLTLNLLTILVFVALTYKIFKKREERVLAVIIFALIPTAYTWVIFGGGITRSLGFLFVLLTLNGLFSTLGKQYKIRDILVIALPVIGAVLSHPEAGIVSLLTTGIFLMVYDHSRQGINFLLKIFFITITLTSWWWITVLTLHGFRPILDAFSTEYRSRSFALGYFPSILNAGMAGALSLPAFLGLIVTIRFKKWFFPIFICIVALLLPRYANTPVAVFFAFLSVMGINKTVEIVGSRKQNKIPRSLLYLGIYIVVVLSIMIVSKQVLSSAGYVRTLSFNEREGMLWVAKNTTESSKFFVVSSLNRDWAADHTAEWFPVLANRKSILTCQGTEWLPNKIFSDLRTKNDAFKRAQYLNPDQLFPLIQKESANYDYLFVVGDVPSGLRNNKQFEEVYRKDSVRIYYQIRE